MRRAAHEQAPDKTSGIDPRFGQPAVLETDIVIVIDIIQTDDIIAPVEQTPNEVEPDEPRRARNKDLQRPTPE
jgi:hypothetical protein